MAEDWWQTAFAADYLARYAHRSQAAASEEVAGVLERLAGAPGPVLDACCGAGRHVRALRAAGLTVVGFDWSADLCRAAAGHGDSRGRVFRSDVRQPAVSAGWGAITLFFTAFGYFDEADNRATLATLTGLLAAGGWLMLDLPEPARVRAGLVAESCRGLADGSTLRERRHLDGPWVIKDIDHGGRHYQERVRLYEPAEITRMAQSCGLDPVETWPSLRGPAVDEGRLVHWLRRSAWLRA